MPLQVRPTRGHELRRHGEHHCTGAGRTLSEEQSGELPDGAQAGSSQTEGDSECDRACGPGGLPANSY